MNGNCSGSQRKDEGENARQAKLECTGNRRVPKHSPSVENHGEKKNGSVEELRGRGG